MSDNGDQATQLLENQLQGAIAQRDGLNEQIARLRAALDLLNGNVPPPRVNRASETVRKSVLAALGSFDGPVHTSRLLDHELLVHYSRHTLRSALADLHHAEMIQGDRAPKGFIWDPRSANGRAEEP